MKKNINFLILSLVIAIISSFKLGNDPKLDELKVTANYNDLTKSSVAITLLNNSDDTIAYQSMSCNWQSSFRTNSKIVSVKYYPDNCFKTKNKDTIIMIAPHKYQTRILTLMNALSFEGNDTKVFQIGFEFIKAVGYKKTKRDISQNSAITFWSNNLIL